MGAGDGLSGGAWSLFAGVPESRRSGGPEGRLGHGVAMTHVARALSVLKRASGAERAILLDTAGRTLAHQGFDQRERVMQAASLAAAVHATATRIAEALGDDGIGETRTVGGSKQVVLNELATPTGPLLLLTVFPSEQDMASIRPAYAVFERSLALLPELGGDEAETPEDFEESLMRSLNRLFPKEYRE